MVSRVPGEVEHHVTLFDKYFTKKQVLFVLPTWMWPENKDSKVPGGIYALLLCLYNTSVTFSVSSLLPTCV